jgi:hypothetical protein
LPLDDIRDAHFIQSIKLTKRPRPVFRALAEAVRASAVEDVAVPGRDALASAVGRGYVILS